MSRKVTIILAGLLVILLGNGIWIYTYLNDPSTKEIPLEARLGDDILDFSEIERELSEMKEKAEGSPGSGGQKSSSSVVDSVNEMFSDAEDYQVEVTEEAIVSKYKPQFKKLEDIALERIEKLIAHAYRDYQKQRDRGTLNPARLARDYYEVADKMQNQVDGIFNNLLDQLEEELIEHQQPTHIVSEIKKEYEQKIQEKERELINKFTQ
ncbi:uncharacterized protein YeeX (DUF496 family) [Desulfitispora alkaliphila]|uniref:hypothetical protein n=1 Tax=Desulfitispora alkaliphila TaxID=622674 RepID=UPI003D21C0FB